MLTRHIRNALAWFLGFFNNLFFLIWIPITATLYRRHHMDFLIVRTSHNDSRTLLCLMSYHRLSVFIGETPPLRHQKLPVDWCTCFKRPSINANHKCDKASPHIFNKKPLDKHIKQKDFSLNINDILLNLKKISRKRRK